MASDLTIRYASSDADVVAVHGFLCVVAGPNLPGNIDAKDSATEVWRCAHENVVIMAMRGDMLVGTLGLIHVGFWWNTKIKYLANRFFFTLPGSKTARPLLKEGIAIAKASDLELHIIDERRRRLIIFNAHPRRSAVNQVLAPPAIRPPPAIQTSTPIARA